MRFYLQCVPFCANYLLSTQKEKQRMEPSQTLKKQRYHFLDTLRGLTLISMIIYHGTWDLVYLYGVDWAWYKGSYAYVWQQSICWTFILLSGFCWSFGRQHLRRGLLVFGGGALVTVVTMLFMWEDRVVFGVLTMLGSCMLLMIPLDKWTRKWNSWAGLAASGLLFVLTRNLNRGSLGFEGLEWWKIPGEMYRVLYRGLFETYLGFTDPDPKVSFSTDYFSIIPWFFLFLTGYFIHQLMQNYKLFDKERVKTILQFHVPPLSFIGRHSLIIYMLHQPILYGIFQLGFLLLLKQT